MISFTVPGQELYDEIEEKVYVEDDSYLEFEHSLKSLSIWEHKYKRSFLESVRNSNLSTEEAIDYYSMMCINDDIEPEYLIRNPSILVELKSYMSDPHTATTIKSSGGSGNRMVMSSEVIYAFMSNGQIPYTCDTWNLNNLLKVIDVLGVLNSPKKEVPVSDIYTDNAKLNEQRRAAFNSKG